MQAENDSVARRRASVIRDAGHSACVTTALPAQDAGLRWSRSRCWRRPARCRQRDSAERFVQQCRADERRGDRIDGDRDRDAGRRRALQRKGPQIKRQRAAEGTRIEGSNHYKPENHNKQSHTLKKSNPNRPSTRPPPPPRRPPHQTRPRQTPLQQTHHNDRLSAPPTPPPKDPRRPKPTAPLPVVAPRPPNHHLQQLLAVASTQTPSLTTTLQLNPHPVRPPQPARARTGRRPRHLATSPLAAATTPPAKAKPETKTTQPKDPPPPPAPCLAQPLLQRPVKLTAWTVSWSPPSFGTCPS